MEQALEKGRQFFEQLVNKIKGSVDTDKIRNKADQVLEQAMAKAHEFMNKHNKGDLKAKLEGAMEQAKTFIEKAQGMTQEEKEEALEKGRQAFEDLMNKVKGSLTSEDIKAKIQNRPNAGKRPNGGRRPNAGGLREKAAKKAKEMAMKKAAREAEELAKKAAEEAARKAEEEAKALAEQAAREAEELANKAADEAKNAFGKLFG